MQKFSDYVFAKSGGYLVPAAGASVTVKTYPGGAVATIYSDNGVTPQANPITADSEGLFSFYAADGRYTLEISGGGYTGGSKTDILLEDNADASAGSFTTLSATGTGAFGVASNPTGAAGYFRQAADQNLEILLPGLSATGGRILTRTNAGAVAPLELQGSSVKLVDGSGVLRSEVTSTGLSVTGTLTTSIAGTGRNATFAGSGDRLRLFTQTGGNGVLLDVTDAGETTTARPLSLGGSNGTVNLVGTTAVVSSTGLSVTGTLSATATTKLVGTLPVLQIGPDAPSSNDYGRITFTTSNTQKNWQISSNAVVTPGSLEFTPSTAAGGTTFTTPAMTLDASGNLGVGITPAQRLDVAQDQNANTWARIRNNDTGSSAYAGLMINANGNSWGMRMGSGAANSNALQFVLDALGTPSAKMTLDASGNLLVDSASSTLNDEGFRVLVNGSGSSTLLNASNTGGGLALALNTTADTNVAQFFRSNSAVGSISVTTTATAYNTSSDYRLKENVLDLSGSGEFIDSLRPRSWTWKSNGSSGVGFIAHELQAVSPSSVVGEKDAVDEDGNAVYQCVEYGSAEVIAMLVAEVKSLRTRVAALEAA